MEPYIVSIISAIVGYFSSIFANRKPKGDLPTIGLLTLLAGTATVLTFLGQWMTAPRPTPPPPPDKLEGQWVEKYKDGENDIYAIAGIRYNSEAKYLEFSGTAYDVSLTVVGRWRSIQARLDRDQYDYLFEGESWNRLDSSRQGLRKGVGGIFFDSPNHGTGKFLSIRDDKVPRGFEIHRILNEDAAQESINNPKGLIQKFYEDPMYFKKVTSAN